MDIDASASTAIIKNTGNVSRSRTPSLRAHCHWPTTWWSDLAGSSRSSSDRAEDATCCRRSSSARAASTEWKSIPIIVRDVMLDRFREYSGGVYANPRVSAHIEDGRSFVRRSRERFDVIQASLVDTWAATAAGAYTLTENSLYTTEAFGDYLDHLTPDGLLTITRWVLRRTSSGDAGARGVHQTWPRSRTAHRDRAPRAGRDVPSQEDAVLARGRTTPAASWRTISASRCCMRRACQPPRPTQEPERDAEHRHEHRGLSHLDPHQGSGRRFSRATRSTSVPRPTIVLSSFTPHVFAISSGWRSAARCCSVTGSAPC